MIDIDDAEYYENENSWPINLVELTVISNIINAARTPEELIKFLEVMA